MKERFFLRRKREAGKLPFSASSTFRVALIVLGGAILGFAGADAVGHHQAGEPPESETVVYVRTAAPASAESVEVSDLKTRNRRLEALVKILQQRADNERSSAGH